MQVGCLLNDPASASMMEGGNQSDVPCQPQWSVYCHTEGGEGPPIPGKSHHLSSAVYPPVHLSHQELIGGHETGQCPGSFFLHGAPAKTLLAGIHGVLAKMEGVSHCLQDSGVEAWQGWHD